ncbi:MAG: CBS domain-containing protein [Candidatus Jordarchaeales archaeon]
MLVKEVMTRDLIVVDKDASLSFAIELMVKNRVSRLLVLNNGKLVGILTERDILDRLGSSRIGTLQASSIHVSSAMTLNPITIPPELDVVDAAKIMIEKKISGLPVVEKDELVGLVTKSTMTKLCSKVKTITVSQLMTPNPITIPPYEKITNARRIMLEKGISSLPVIESGQLVGFVTEGMIARYLAEFRDAVPERYQDTRIKQIEVSNVMKMIPPLLPDEKISSAVEKFVKERIKAAPVVSKEGRLVGIITKTDFTRLVANRFSLP